MDFLDIARERSYRTPYANSSLFPLLLMSLAVQKNCPDTKKDFRKSYDYIVVGAGSAGSVVASRLSEKSCVSVLLLEDGKRPSRLTDVPAYSTLFFGSDMFNEFQSTSQKHASKGFINQQVPVQTARVFGGGSTLNGLLFIRGNRKDYDTWVKNGAKGWSYDEVLPYFKKMEGNENFDELDRGYHNRSGPLSVSRPSFNSIVKDVTKKAVEELGYNFVDVNGKEQEGLFDMQFSVRNGQRCSAAKAYLVPAENRPNLDILAEAFVTKVLIKNKSAVGVRFRFQGREHEVFSKREVILSAGALGSPKILMLSGIGPKKHLKEKNIPVLKDLPVGKNLQDHPVTPYISEVSSEIPIATDQLRNNSTLLDYIFRREGFLTTSYNCAYLAFLGSNAEEEKWPKYQIFLMHSGTGAATRLFASNMKSEVIKQVFDPFYNKTSVQCIIFLLRPKSRGNIKLTSSNPDDPLLIDLNTYSDSRDILDMVEGLKMCKAISETKAFEKLGKTPFRTLYPGCESLAEDDDKYFACQTQSHTFSGHHYVGTCKMGSEKDNTTVVDPELRVKGVKGLRVIDGSIMPTIVSGNTNIPIIMIAEKISDLIKEGISNC